MITRSTYGTFRQVTEIMQSTALRLQESQMDAATLDRLRHPSDHPLDASEALRLDADLEAHEALSDRLVSVTNELATVDGTLGEAANLMVSAKELAVAMETETISTVERATAAQEVAALLDSLVTVANTHYNGIYLFSGTAVDTEPFDDTGTYLGSTSSRSAPLMGSDTMVISYTGDDIFREPSADSIQALQDLYTALVNDDTDAIELAMDEIDNAHSHLVSMRGIYGAAYSRAEELTYASEEASAALNGFIGILREMDMVEAFSQLSQAQILYESSATTLSSVLGTNIFQYI